MSAEHLAAEFLMHLADDRRGAWEQVEGLGARLGTLHEVGRSAWPDIDLSAELFVRHLATHLGAAKVPETALTGSHVADLFVAAASAAGDARAVTAIMEHHFPQLRVALQYLGSTSATADDVKAQMLEQLFVGRDGGRPKIAGYSGRGELRSWLRSFAVRTAMKLRGRRENAYEEVPEDLASPGADPELAHLKSLYGDAFNAAVTQAVGDLSPRDRTLLRYSALDGLGIDELARLYRVHRATAARWLTAARAALFDDTRTRLMAQLGIEASELDSIIRLVRSQLDVSLRRLLQ